MEAKFVVNGKEYEIPTEFTLGEEAEMEQITGQGYDLSNPGARGLLAIAYVTIKRVDPTIRLDDLKMLRADDFDVKAEGAEPVSPLPEAGSSDSSATSTGDGSTVSAGEEPTPAPTGT